MGIRAHQQDELVEEAARIMCEQGLVDYRAAKAKAAERLGVPAGTPLPANSQVHDAVLAYQQLFGGQRHHQQLQAMRETAIKAMELLEEFEPRLVGALLSGAIHDGHRIQLHAFADMPEALDFLLEDRGIACQPGERRYRVGKRDTRQFPMLQFEAGGHGIDVTIFPESGGRNPPLSPVDGKPMRRLTLTAARKLLEAEQGGG